MRLIDADVYLKKICKYEADGCGSCKFQTVCPVDEPTVEAIPISWMNDYMFHLGNIYGPMDISSMIWHYRKGFVPSVPEKGPIK